MSDAATELDLTQSRQRWWMLGGMWLSYSCFGLMIVSLAPLVEEVTADLDMTLTQMGIALGAWSAVYCFFAIPAGAALDRFGLRRCLLIGTLLIGLSALLRSIAVDFWTFTAAITLFGFGGPLLSIGAPKLIARWFSPEQRGMAMGIYMSGPAVGSMIALSATDSLLMPLFDHNWRAVIQLYAGIAAFAAAVWWWISSHAASRAAEGEPAPPFDPTMFIKLLSIRQVQLVLVLAIGSFVLAHSVNGWLPEILRDRGYTEVQSGFWATLPVAVGILGIILIPRFATAGRRIYMLLGMFSLAAISMLWLAATTPPVIVAGLVMLGVARAAMWPVVMLVLMDVRGVDHRNMGAAGGLFFSLGELGGVTGPVAIGWLADRSGAFTQPLYLLAGICGLMMLVTLGLRYSRS